jgi:hypothetical protein
LLAHSRRYGTVRRFYFQCMHIYVYIYYYYCYYYYYIYIHTYAQVGWRIFVCVLVGVENGVCDGFGTCLCRPPFITEDCAVKDCRGNCSGHGWCSVEYPVSRCMCDPRYFGDLCEHKLCLNNCSWPNGECILEEGFFVFASLFLLFLISSM